MAEAFECRSVLGLGVTSVMDFVRTMSKYKAIKDEGAEYITANTFTLPKRNRVLVFDSVREVIRFSKSIKPGHVVVISDTPVILKSVPDLVPLDYSNDRSFEFNFQEVDPQRVLKAIRAKTTVSCRLVSFDNLGYHVNRIKSSGELINAYITVTSSMPFDKRNILREAVTALFMSKKPSIDGVKSALAKIGSGYASNEDLKTFTGFLEKQYKTYHAAVTSTEVPAIAAKKHDVDPYAVSYFRRLIRQKAVNEERIAKNNVKFKSKTA